MPIVQLSTRTWLLYLTFIEAEDRTLEGALKLRGQLSWRHVERVYVLRKRWV